MEFTITAQNGDSVKIEGENWMVAMGKAMTFFQVDIFDLGKIICSPGADDSIFIDNPSAHRSWMVRKVVPKITVVAAAASTNLEEEAQYEEPKSLEEEAAATAELAKSPPPALQMPVTSSLKKEVEDPETLAERLFDLSMDLAMASADEACRVALELIGEFVTAEATSIARGTINDPELRFVAATGPVADEIIGRTVQFGEGLIGMCFDMQGTLMVAEVETGGRHLDQFDAETGFKTVSALCVPISDEEGQSYGVIQLLNPPGDGFTDQHAEIVQTIARTLAGSLSNQQLV